MLALYSGDEEHIIVNKYKHHNNEPHKQDLPFISSLMMIPVSGTMIPDPKRRLTVVVSVNAIPEASAVTM